MTSPNRDAAGGGLRRRRAPSTSSSSNSSGVSATADEATSNSDAGQTTASVSSLPSSSSDTSTATADEAKAPFRRRHDIAHRNAVLAADSATALPVTDDASAAQLLQLSDGSSLSGQTSPASALAPSAVIAAPVSTSSSSRERGHSKKKRRRPAAHIGEMLDRLAEFENMLHITGSKNAACAALKCSKGTIDAYTSKLQQLVDMGIDVQQYRDVKLTELANLVNSPPQQQQQMPLHIMTPQLIGLTNAFNQHRAGQTQTPQSHPGHRDTQILPSSGSSTGSAELGSATSTHSTLTGFLHYPLISTSMAQQLQLYQLMQQQQQQQQLPSTSTALSSPAATPGTIYYRMPSQQHSGSSSSALGGLSSYPAFQLTSDTSAAAPLASPLHAQLHYQLQNQFTQAPRQAQVQQQVQHMPALSQPLPPSSLPTTFARPTAAIEAAVSHRMGAHPLTTASVSSLTPSHQTAPSHYFLQPPNAQPAVQQPVVDTQSTQQISLEMLQQQLQYRAYLQSLQSSLSGAGISAPQQFTTATTPLHSALITPPTSRTGGTSSAADSSGNQSKR